MLDQDEHPIAETVSNLAPPLHRGGVRRRRRVPRAAALEGADDPRLRRAPGDRCRRAGDRRHRRARLDPRHPRVDEAAPTNAAPSLVERIVVKLGGLPTKAGLGLVIASMFLFVGGILVEGRTKIESDPVKWIDQGSQVVADVDHARGRDRLRHHARRARPGQQHLRPGRHRSVHEFTIAAEARPEVVSVLEPRQHDGEDHHDPRRHRDPADGSTTSPVPAAVDAAGDRVGPRQRGRIRRRRSTSDSPRRASRNAPSWSTNWKDRPRRPHRGAGPARRAASC